MFVGWYIFGAITQTIVVRQMAVLAALKGQSLVDVVDKIKWYAWHAKLDYYGEFINIPWTRFACSVAAYQISKHSPASTVLALWKGDIPTLELLMTTKFIHSYSEIDDAVFLQIKKKSELMDQNDEMRNQLNVLKKQIEEQIENIFGNGNTWLVILPGSKSNLRKEFSSIKFRFMQNSQFAESIVTRILQAQTIQASDSQLKNLNVGIFQGNVSELIYLKLANPFFAYRSINFLEYRKLMSLISKFELLRSQSSNTEKTLNSDIRVLLNTAFQPKS